MSAGDSDAWAKVAILENVMGLRAVLPELLQLLYNNLSEYLISSIEFRNFS